MERKFNIYLKAAKLKNGQRKKRKKFKHCGRQKWMINILTGALDRIQEGSSTASTISVVSKTVRCQIRGTQETKT